MLAKLFGRGVPAYLWIAVFYVIYVGLIAAGGAIMGDSAEAPVGAVEALQPEPTETVVQRVERILNEPMVHIPLFSGAQFPVTWTTLFIIAGMISAWIEVWRATNAKFSGNDFMSLIVTLISLILFVGVEWFGTTAFMIVPLVGVGDLLLDRLVGQAVARRDFGPLYNEDG